MFRTHACLLMGLVVVVAGTAAVSGCGGDEFGSADPNASPDGASDTQTPSNDQNATGGAGGNGGAGASGGAGGGSSGSGGAGGGSSGSGGSNGGGRGDAAVDSGGGGRGGSDMKDDASNDAITGDASDAPARVDADAGRSADGPTSDVPIDAKDAADAPSNRGDTSVGSDTGGSADAFCGEPVTYYKDNDGDGFGNDSETMAACVPPGLHWATVGGDCRDDLPAVKPFKAGSPDNPAYSGTGYSDPNQPQGVSFDYDCSGTEDADPSNSYGVEPDCSNVLNCTGVGYVAVNPSRTGPGIDPYCGSTSLKRCMLLVANGGPALCSSTLEVTMTPYRCR